jgi:hypothetical protein
MVEETFVADSARLQESRLLLAKRVFAPFSICDRLIFAPSFDPLPRRTATS